MSINRLTSYPWQASHKSRIGSNASELSGRSPAAIPVTDLLSPRVPSQDSPSFRTILVPLDGTALGERALPTAVSIAKQAHARLRLVHIYAPLRGDFYPTSYAGVDLDLYQQQFDYVRRVSRHVADAAGITVIPECFRQHNIAEGICEAANQSVDLVVAATHGYGWLERVWSGSIIHSLIDKPVPPMLIMRGDGLRAAIAPDKWLRRVLVPLDGSREAEEVLNLAVMLGSPYEADYSLLSVVRSNDQLTAAWSPPETWEKRVAANDYLREAVDRMRQREQNSMAHVAVTDESIAQAIVARAEASRVDCIAMMSGDRRGLQRWFRPSVTRRVIQLSQLPILVLREGAA